jgi:hypothetical protein
MLPVQVRSRTPQQRRVFEMKMIRVEIGGFRHQNSPDNWMCGVQFSGVSQADSEMVLNELHKFITCQVNNPKSPIGAMMAKGEQVSTYDRDGKLMGKA